MKIMFGACCFAGLLALAGCSSDAVLGDVCTEEDDCEGLTNDPVCHRTPLGNGICTIYCDIEETFCAEMTGGVCTRQETRLRPDVFADDRCDRLGGDCELSGARTVCIR